MKKEKDKFRTFMENMSQGHTERYNRYARDLEKQSVIDSKNQLNDIEKNYIKSKKMPDHSEADSLKIREEAQQLRLVKEKEVKDKIKQEVTNKLKELQYRQSSFRAKTAIKRLNGELPDSEIELEDDEE